MRFRSQVSLSENIGRARIKRKFLFRYRQFDYRWVKTDRWLEWAWVVERVRSDHAMSFFYWDEIGWADEMLKCQNSACWYFGKFNPWTGTSVSYDFWSCNQCHSSWEIK